MSLSYKQQKSINKFTFGLSTMGAGFSLGDISYNFKQSLRSLQRFFKTIWNFRSFDYHYTLEVLSVCLMMQLEDFREEKSFKEIDETRLPKEAKIERCLQLLSNIREDNFRERCGYDNNYESYFKPIPGSDNFTMESTETPGQKQHNAQVLHEATELEESEWNELMDILKVDLKSFWT
jgi:hypothetical protein